MKETKKMLEIIEKQYRQANKEYNEKQEKNFKKQCRNDFIFNALVFMNLVILLILLGRM